MLTHKKCVKCNNIKILTEFSLANSNADGYNNTCKKCVAIRTRAYYKTLPGVITRIYNGEKQASKDRNHPMPTYTKKELSLWLYDNGIEKIYLIWKSSKYQKNLSPSVDRLNSTLPYTFNNIRLVTWKDNNEIAYIERKNCKRITKQCKEINQLTLNDEIIQTFGSIAHAARETGFCRTNINFACKKGRDIAHGYKWEYTK